ncbi:MAG: hypothetical protein C0501_24125 [Isosphaera sp.]|nr:hypothetical protein [Isosphaera sp.]
MTRLATPVSLLVVVALHVAVARAAEPTEAEAVAALEKLGAKINGANPKNAAIRPVTGVLFPRKGCDVTDDDLAHLKAFKKIEYVYIIDQKRVTGGGLKHLSGLKTLRTIDLHYTPIESKHLVHLEDMTWLHKLGLWSTKVDDDGIPHLKGLQLLEHLYLDKTAVGDKGVEALGPNKSLCNVGWEGSKVTAKGEAVMKKNFPRLGLEPLRGD